MATHAIHIVFTTYGTWLPGDARGHWSPLYDLYGRLVQAGHQLNLPDEPTREFAAMRLKEVPKILSLDERELLAETLEGHFSFRGLAMERRGYLVPANALPGQGQGYMKPTCLAAGIEDNHVHLLLGPLEEDLDRYVGRLKGQTSSVLKRLPGNGSRTHIWTAKFWRVFLYDNLALQTVRSYIINHNIRRGMRADPYPWVTAL